MIDVEEMFSRFERPQTIAEILHLRIELSSTLSLLLPTNKTPRYIGYRCITLIRVKFIELARYCNTAVLPVICARADVLALAIQRRATPNRTSVTCCCFLLLGKGCRV